MDGNSNAGEEPRRGTATQGDSHTGEQPHLDKALRYRPILPCKAKLLHGTSNPAQSFILALRALLGKRHRHDLDDKLHPITHSK